MRYPGSKARFAKDLVRIISEYRGDRDAYLEPFLGGANSFAVIAPLFTYAAAGDAHRDMAMMWHAVSQGWLPPEHVTEDEYAQARSAPSSASRGFIGSGCSFGGKWFGGYARGGTMASGEPRDHQAESYRAVAKKADAMKGRHIHHRDFDEWHVSSRMVVYCDPPYAGTLEYASKIDHKQFWSTAGEWVAVGALVLVSEQSAPEGWVPVHAIGRSSNTALTKDRTVTTEHVFIHQSQA